MDELLEPGQFVIVQRQKYTKLYKLKEHGTIQLGKDIIEMDNVLGHRYFETFKMVQKPNNKRIYMLEKTETVPITSQINIQESGKDNRDITDDGFSQSLSKDEIEKLRDEDALSSADIVEKLITNSKSFNKKTEYSQEKYIRKKEKKYFEFIQVRKPSIRLLAEMFYRQEPSKVLGVRIDDLSQILTYSNVQADGNFLLYDSGSSGLICAAIMNAIGANNSGQLIHAHPGNECQKNAFVAMNFPKEQIERCVNVNIYSVLRWYYQGGLKDEEQDVKDDQNEDELNSEAVATEPNEIIRTLEAKTNTASENCEKDLSKGIKRAHEDNSSGPPAKKPCWHYDNEKACEILKNKVDSLIIVAKEHPESIVNELAQFLKPSRTLVVFSTIVEPLEELYFYLKKRLDFINIKITNNFLRSYQVLPERTHPEITMNFGGYLLTAFKIKF